MPRPADLEFFATISQPNDEKILLVVIDGLGGLHHPDFGGKTELEYASAHGLLPNITKFVRQERTVTGLIYPVARGIIPGSGAGHLGLFGYDPLMYRVKRGAIEAAGAENVPQADVWARLNFSHIDGNGTVEDRRAGRLGYSSTRGQELAEKLNANFKLPGVIATVVATKDHRGVLALKRKHGSQLPLDDDITDTDPGEDGKPIMPCEAGHPQNHAALQTAEVVQELTRQAGQILAAEEDANIILLREFAHAPHLPSFEHVFKVRPAVIALYPLYRGVARLVGMAVLDAEPKNLEDQINVLDAYCDDFNFFYLHYKKPDVMGEDKDFLGKVDAMAEFDKLLPRITEGNRFSVIAITGDHSTPSVLGRHSEHSVPVAINASTMKGYDKTSFFTEGECVHGSLGRLLGIELMPILMSKAGKFRKFGG